VRKEVRFQVHSCRRTKYVPGSTKLLRFRKRIQKKERKINVSQDKTNKEYETWKRLMRNN
jgi:hypothetical protein